jgi:hypothetical protein
MSEKEIEHSQNLEGLFDYDRTSDELLLTGQNFVPSILGKRKR